MHSIRPSRRILLGLCLASLLAATGCEYRAVYVAHNKAGQKSYELNTSRQVPWAPGTVLDVQTSSGSITVTGTDAADANITATITGYGPTVKEAQEIAEQTAIEVTPVGQAAQIRAKTPRLGNNRGVSVSYDIAVPRRAGVVLRSAYGSLRITEIEGTVDGRTSSGAIEAEAIAGTTTLDTAYGSIACTDIVGETITLHSSSGAIAATDIEGSARFESSYGSVTCVRFSGSDLTLKSGSGPINISDAEFTACDAWTSYGSVTARDVRGDLLKCKSGSGSIDVSDALAPAMDLSTSYGNVHARNVTTDNLNAVSSSGAVEVACAPACPPNLTAIAKSSYGSVTFAAPPGFGGRVVLASSYGAVETDLPVTVTGRLGDKKRIEGTVGQGNGRLDLQTGNGSVTLR